MNFLDKCRLAPATVFLAAVTVWPFAASADAGKSSQTVSYYKQVRPIFQAQCQGCHQPAKSKGGYVMTEFTKMFAPGDSGKKAIVAGKPEASHLLEQITPKDGEAEMPKGKPALVPPDIELIRQWIAQGAKDDTPKDALKRIDAQHPPVYQRPPVVTSLDYSPDGSLLAVAGFHEVLLHKGDGSGIVARLVGLSERIETVRFSPDGKLLATAGGLPSRLGEIQVWDVATRKLKLSTPVTYDDVYGVSWSPDGKLLAFGCADNTVRAIETETGKQVVQQGSHNDWVLDTAFSTKGDHIVSVGRDMSTKLTEVESQRFIDNVSSITPGALRGGLHSIARNPTKDEILIGGADGTPQIYRIFRQTKRVIGDNAALIRRFPPMEGRIYSVDYSPDGKRVFAGASLDGKGAVNIYSADFDSKLPTNIVAIVEKVASTQNQQEKDALEKYLTADVKLLSSTPIDAGVYAVSCSPDGNTIAAAGEDGWIRFISTSDGKVRKEFASVPVSGKQRNKPKPTVVTTTAAVKQ